ncbi:MAG: 4Fe-4S dicluster domain-containing protein [Verrucomicrobia bacterium]|nr:4Fe-4S dicluster domain-containing protein [Verrucomicrobiota bacterium]
MSKVKASRTAVRLLLLAAALFFAIGGPLPVWLKRLIPALSPLTTVAESIAQRAGYAGFFWALPPLTLLVLAFWKGRFFCQHLCPLGTLYSLPQKFSLKKKLLPIRLNALIFWLVMFSSVFGLPALLFLDPLSTFNRIGIGLTWGPGLLVPAFLLLSFFQPQVWCTHLCPLGYGFDLVHRKTGKQVFNRDRRQFLAGLGIGGAAALILPKVGKKSANPSVLPPGATVKFAKTCTRCYACVSACPSKIIRIKSGGGLTELSMPELRFDHGICEEFCNRCSQVCPTGAIRTLTQSQKHSTQIGIARIEKEKCLAWADNEYCMVCDEYCSYGAIETEWHGEIACPVINQKLCRGCGGCENACPAVRAGKALLIHPLNPQTTIEGKS